MRPEATATRCTAGLHRDTQPYGTGRAPDRGDVLNVGGFSDAVFTVMQQVVSGQTPAEHWAGVIERISMTPQ